MELDFGFAKAIMTTKEDGNYKHKDGIIFANQIHSDIIKIVTDDKSFDGDGLITYQKGLKIGVYVADCMPIIIIDEHKKGVAILHSGRVGTFLDIFSKAIKALDTDVSKLKIYLGASIRSCCYEVGREIEKEAKTLGYSYAIIKKADKIYLDTLYIIKEQIAKNGILPHQVTIDESCSCCDDRYFSYRENGTCDRFGAYVWIK